MCGIAGVVCFNGTGASAELLRRMVAQVRYRGPDESGVYVDGQTGLGHARLSIIDLCGGRQPMHNADRSLSVTFNGEIFNYLELRETLAAEGHHFATQSDTEVILHAYQQYGEDCTEHFNGQWAFAIWDKRHGRLFLSRDRLGIRPLHYTVAGGKFLFASEVKSLLVDTDVERQIDPIGLDQVFTFWSTLPPRTVFRGINELPPGHNMVVEGRELRTRRYWQLDYDDQRTSTTPQQCAEELLALLLDATRLRLRSDVPVGAYLSGGLDSTINAALVKQCTNAHLRTFSVTFEDAEFDESPYQKAAVDYLQTDHTSIQCNRQQIGRIFPEVIWHTEQPVLRTAPAPLYLLSKLVHQRGYKVVLTGEGADEMLGGYDVFKEAKVRRFWAAQPDSAFRAGLLRRLYPYLPNIQAQSLAYQKAFFHVRPEDLASPLFSHLPRWELTSRLKSFFSPELRAEIADRDVYADCRALLPEDFANWHPFCQAQYLETAMLMPGYILSSQGDRVAMAHSVEGRFPFLDHRLAEFAAGIPPRLKMKALKEKYILKLAAGHLIPAEVRQRTKQPYRAPDAASFFGGAADACCDYKGELLSPTRIREDGLFDPDAVEHLVRKAERGRAVGIKDNMALVGILSTQLVVDQFVRNFDTCSASAIDARSTILAQTPWEERDGWPADEPVSVDGS
ncbi:MAG: asparagine synthase (glutamine-hydrolyzing) [Planctomycetes bacterium RBG_13_63_9]|nr:MAG: asparagine synthase (glutamine-hydrolyzing) [Planctomycetes bacterium RBG_13_63_9]